MLSERHRALATLRRNRMFRNISDEGLQGLRVQRSGNHHIRIKFPGLGWVYWPYEQGLPYATALSVLQKTDLGQVPQKEKSKVGRKRGACNKKTEKIVVLYRARVASGLGHEAACQSVALEIAPGRKKRIKNARRAVDRAVALYSEK